MGTSSIHGGLSIATFDYRRVYIIQYAYIMHCIIICIILILHRQQHFHQVPATATNTTNYILQLQLRPRTSCHPQINPVMTPFTWSILWKTVYPHDEQLRQQKISWWDYIPNHPHLWPKGWILDDSHIHILSIIYYILS